MRANKAKQQRKLDKYNKESSLTKKRQTFWVSIMISAGSIIGSHYFPYLIIPGVSFLFLSAALSYSIDSQQAETINTMKPDITLEELVQDGFPDEDNNPNERIVKKPTTKNNKENVSKVANDVWAHQVLFSDASRVSALAPCQDVKENVVVVTVNQGLLNAPHQTLSS